MDLGVSRRRIGIWHNLPIRLKALVGLLLPVPLVELCVIALGLSGFHRFQVIVLPAAGLELLAFLWVVNAAHRRIRELQRATDRISRGQAWEELRPYCWESNAINRNLRSLAADLPQLKREHAESREEAARLFEETPAAYLETDAQGLVTRANSSACRLLGRSPEEIRRKHLWEVVGAAEGPASRAEFLARVEQAETIDTFDQKYVRPDGTRAMIEIQERLLRNGAGGPCGIWWSLTDRTAALRAAETIVDCETAMQIKDEELARAVSEAADARQAEARFLSKVSSDLRAPLNAIVGFAELMVDGKVGAKAAERRECLRDILSSARELTGMVDRLLDQGKARANEPSSGSDPEDMEALVHEVGRRMRALPPPSRSAQVFQSVRADAEGYRLELEYRGIPNQEPGAAGWTGNPQNCAELAQVKEFVEKRGGRAGVRISPGGTTVLYAVLPQPRTGRRRAATVAVLQSGAAESSRTPDGDSGGPALGAALEGAGIRRDCGKPILVAGGTPHGLKELAENLRGLGHDPIGLTNTSDILRAVDREQPAGVVVDVRGDDLADYESVRGSLCSAGVELPLVGFCGVPEAPVDSEAQIARPRLQSVPGGGRKRSA